MMAPFDGTYSEGSHVNAVGLLGLASPSILWVYGTEVGKDDATADTFFQTHLRMGVFPMAPFPGNDHAITPSAFADGQYLRYGSMLKAMRGADWILDANPIRVSPSHAQVNAFVVPATPAVMTSTTESIHDTRTGAPQSPQRLLFPIMLAGANATEAQIYPEYAVVYERQPSGVNSACYESSSDAE